MSAQESTLAIVPVPKPAEPPEERVKRPNRGSSHWGKRQNAITRIPQLLAEVRQLKQQRQQDRIEAQAALKLADEEIARLKGELLAVLAERDDLKARDEDRLFQADEDRKAAHQVEADHRILCFRAVVDVAHQTDAYAKHPDFDTRLKRAEGSFSNELLETILCFPKPVIPELFYVLATTEGAARRLSALALIPKCLVLSQVAAQHAGEVMEQMKLEALRRSL